MHFLNGDGSLGQRKGVEKMKRKLQGWRILALITVLVMLLTTVPALAFAESAKTRGSEDETVTVYVTISDDGNFVTGNDTERTVMARVPVTVSYFDLADYGLQDYYRYEADSFENGGGYIGDKVIRQPTLLHCYIRILEQYYLNGEKLEVGKSKLPGAQHCALSLSGAPCSLFMPEFWGHDLNLLYYVDHAFPLMAKGWGSTADYILLQDGMEIDLGMFSDWNFYHYGAFAYFDSTEKTAFSGIPFELTMLAASTRAAENGASAEEDVPMERETIRISKDLGRTWEAAEAVTDSSGKVQLTMNDPGVYYISAGPQYESYNMENGAPCVAPPICKVTVRDKIPVTGIKMDKQQLALAQGQKETLRASMIPANADDRRVTWISSEPLVAEVDGAGTVTALKEGTAVITATSKEGGYTAACQVTVTKEEEPVKPEEPAVPPAVTKPEIPSKIKAESAGYNGVRISWDPVSKADGYQIYRSTVKSGGYTPLKSTGAVGFKNTGLKTGKTYYYKVRAYKQDGQKIIYGDFSGIVSAKPVPAAPAKVKAKAGKRSVSVSWSKVSGAKGYKIYRATKKKGKYSAIKTTAKRSFKNKKLKKGKTYYYKVRAYKRISGKNIYGKYSRIVKAKAR